MKKILLFLSFSIIFLFTSCHKEGVKLFADDYSYKTTGNIIVNTESGDTLNLSLSLLGQLDIIADETDDNRVMVIRKPLTGNIITTYATVSGKTITFEPYSFVYYHTSTSLNGDMQITVTAEGEIFNDNMIVITEQYTGTFKGTRTSTFNSEEDVSGTIVATDVKTIAEKNND